MHFCFAKTNIIKTKRPIIDYSYVKTTIYKYYANNLSNIHYHCSYLYLTFIKQPDEPLFRSTHHTYAHFQNVIDLTVWQNVHEQHILEVLDRFFFLSTLEQKSSARVVYVMFLYYEESKSFGRIRKTQK